MDIIHLTDMHIGADDCLGGPGANERDAKIIFENIVGNIIADCGQNASENIIIITGDLVDDTTKGDEINISVGGKLVSAPKQYKDAKELIDRLTNAGFQVLVIPGNHDYGSGGKGYSKYVKKFKEVFFESEDVTYPKLDWDIHDKIAFIGLDSMAAILTEDRTEEVSFGDDNEDEALDGIDGTNYADGYRTGYLGAYGKLGEEQLKDLDDMLYSVRAAEHIVVYLHHFPFHQKFLKETVHGLHDHKRLEKIIRRRRVSAFLFGHNHHGYKWNYEWGVPRCYDGGSSTGMNDSRIKKRRVSEHRVFDLSKDPGTYTDKSFYRPDTNC